MRAIGRVKVGIVGGNSALAARLIARRQLTAVADLVPVRHSYAELGRAASWLSAEVARANPPAVKGIKGLTAWRLSSRNLVELSLPRGQRLTAAQQATVTQARRRLGDMLTLGTWAGQTRDLTCAWRTTTFDCDPPLRGGVMLYVRSGANYVPQCTAGFNARSTIDGKWYVMTAGHCGPPGRNFYGRHRVQPHLQHHRHRGQQAGPAGLRQRRHLGDQLWERRGPRRGQPGPGRPLRQGSRQRRPHLLLRQGPRPAHGRQHPGPRPGPPGCLRGPALPGPHRGPTAAARRRRPHLRR